MRWTRWTTWLVGGLTVGLTLPGCSEDEDDTPPELPADLSVCAPENGPFSPDITHPYLPFEVGTVHRVEGLEAGTDPVRFEVRPLDETKVIAGVTTRVVEKKDWHGEAFDELVEVARDYYAQAPDGTVCIFGNAAEVHEDGDVEQEGWLHGEDGAHAAIAMPATPTVGLRFTAAFVPEEDGVEVSEITAVGATAETPAGTFDDVVVVTEVGPSVKKYARGVGEIFDDGLALVSRSP